MSSIKDLKKNLKKATTTLMMDALMIQHLKGEKVQNNINEILTEITLLEKDLIHKINHYPKGKKNEIKKYFSEINNKINTSLNELSEKLNKLLE